MKTQRILKIALPAIALLLVIALAGAWVLFGTQLTAANSIEKLDEGLWSMEYKGVTEAIRQPDIIMEERNER